MPACAKCGSDSASESSAIDYSQGSEDTVSSPVELAGGLPTQSETAAIRKNVAALSRAIDSIDQKIIELQERRQRHTEEIFTLNAKIAPIRRLPVEVLCTIFSHSISDRPVEWTSYAPRRIKQHIFYPSVGPWPLTRVCSLWYNVAIGYAPLWSEIIISFDKISPLNSRHASRILQTYLKRSRDAPLKVMLVSDTREGDLCDEILGQLVSSSSRWQVANIYLRPESLCNTFVSLFYPQVFPDLENLTVNASVISKSWNRDTFVASLPHLHDLTVNDIYDDALSLFHAPHPCLSRLKFESCLPRSWSLKIIPFTTMSNLQTLELTHIVLGSNDGLSSITLPSVQKVSFDSAWSLVGLTLPSLQDLALGNDSPVFLLEEFNDFLRRSSCNIETMRIVKIFYQFELMLEELPGLRHLDLTKWVPHSDDAINVFVDGVRRGLVPSLATLSIGLWDARLLRYMPDVVEARCNDEWSPSSGWMPLTVNAYHLAESDLNDATRSWIDDTLRGKGAQVRLLRWHEIR